MKKILLVFKGAALACALTSCTTSSFTSATKPDGTEIKHVRIAPGTLVTTPNGGCIDSTGVMSPCPTAIGGSGNE